MRFIAGVVAFVAASASAHVYALEQAKHRTISRAICDVYGLPWDFCQRVGVEAYNVDKYEWNDLAAHAQAADGQTSCDAANATRDRLRWLGADMHDTLEQLAWTSSADDAEHLAVQLGRALHTVQDNCAHRGMPNPQHAWASLSDTCQGTKLSPDISAAAIDCAWAESAEIMAAFVDTLDASGALVSQLDQVEEGWTHWPTRGDVCEFLKSAKTWDGNDGRWGNDVLVPELRDQLVYSLTVADVSLGDLCEAGAWAIAPQSQSAAVNTSQAPNWCFKVKVYCLGKADAPDEAPPWDDGSAEDDEDPAGGGAGCAVGRVGGSDADGDRATGGAAMLLLGTCLAGFASRRRRRA